MAFASLFAGGNQRPSQEVRIGGALPEGRTYVPVLTTEKTWVSDQVRVATTLSAATDCELLITDPITGDHVFGPDVPTETEVILETVHAYLTDRPVAAHGMLSSRRLARRLREYTEEHLVRTLVVPGTTSDHTPNSRGFERIANRTSCNVVTVNGQGGYRSFASMLLPIANGPHSGLVTDVAASIAAESGTWVDVLHVIPPDPDPAVRAAAERRVEHAAERIGRPESVTTWILEAPDPAAKIIEQSTYYGLTVIGAPQVGRLKQFVYGSTSRAIRKQANSVVIAARTAEHS